MSAVRRWEPRGAAPALPADEVHVWRATLAVLAADDGTRSPLEATLSDDELARMRAFRYERDRRRYLVAHAFLRQVLAGYAGVGARDLAFEAGPFGKPRLAEPTEARSIEFNLSHSDELALLAVARGRPLGVDVEAARGRFDFGEVADVVFSAAERATLAALDGAERGAGFYACWSRKEAYIKATGFGVSQGLAHFDVTLRPSEPAALLADRHDSSALQRWTMTALDPGEGYAAALVAEGGGWRLRQWEWRGSS